MNTTRVSGLDCWKETVLGTTRDCSVGRIDEICPRADGVGSGSRLTDLILALGALSAVSAAVTADSAS